MIVNKYLLSATWWYVSSRLNCSLIIPLAKVTAD